MRPAPFANTPPVGLAPSCRQEERCCLTGRRCGLTCLKTAMPRLMRCGGRANWGSAGAGADGPR
ncbi:hypothetical protein J4714_12960 [Staphylococcus epidermidis]|nr:hypothetical protein [Staphylococcus epidermidis]